MRTKSYDAIVVGVGGMGSAALYHLAERGLKVLGLEQFDIAHDRGSSHGQTRIIRKSYFEHSDYVPLVDRAYDMWAQLERASGRELVCRTGLLLVGPPEGSVISGVRRAAVEHNLEIENIEAASVSERFPGFVVDDGSAALFEPDAGYLRVEECVRAHTQLAVAGGAELLTQQTVREWAADGNGVCVTTDSGQYAAAKLVICGGAWSGQILSELALPLKVRRKPIMWFAARDCHRQENGFPMFGFELGDEFFYGFPAIDERGLKMANHAGGEVVEDPNQLDRELREADLAEMVPFITRHLPGVKPIPQHHSVCMYTMTPDEHFIIDRHPQSEQVSFAAGFSGHGFKFAPVVGSMLADLVIDGATREPLGFLRVDRAGLLPG